MNILLIDHYAGSPARGMEYRPYYLAKHWTEAGHSVVVLCASYSHLRRENFPHQRGLTECWVEGVLYCVVPTGAYEKNDGYRLHNISQFVGKVNRCAALLAEKYRPDVVIASSTYPFDGGPAARIAQKSGAVLLHEIHDLWPFSLQVLHGYRARHPLMLMIRRSVKASVRKADGVLSILPGADRYLEEIGAKPKNYFYLPNGTELEEACRPAPPKYLSILNRYHQKGKFVVLYAGGFAAANALDALVEAALLTQNDVVYLLMGDGMERARIRGKINCLGLENVILLEPVPHSCLNQVLAKADCLYIGAKRTSLYRYGVGMNKLYDYMASGRPILAAMEGRDNPVALCGCGLLAECENPGDIARKLDQMKKLSPEERAHMGQKGREYVERYHSYQVLAARGLEIFSALAAEKRREREKQL